ncbi:hypothetical protein R3P38DRAFT_3172188 [Favolaschia claudopus]|uniref:Uncharacterized protein n=1 Tax=Favolaschia claudopus TaxID=2862362 RepID=A0AAW0DG32_9AGAR
MVAALVIFVFYQHPNPPRTSRLVPHLLAVYATTIQQSRTTAFASSPLRVMQNGKDATIRARSNEWTPAPQAKGKRRRRDGRRWARGSNQDLDMPFSPAQEGFRCLPTTKPAFQATQQIHRRWRRTGGGMRGCRCHIEGRLAAFARPRLFCLHFRLHGGLASFHACDVYGSRRGVERWASRLLCLASCVSPSGRTVERAGVAALIVVHIVTSCTKLMRDDATISVGGSGAGRGVSRDEDDEDERTSIAPTMMERKALYTSRSFGESAIPDLRFALPVAATSASTPTSLLLPLRGMLRSSYLRSRGI